MPKPYSTHLFRSSCRIISMVAACTKHPGARAVPSCGWAVICNPYGLRCPSLMSMSRILFTLSRPFPLSAPVVVAAVVCQLCEHFCRAKGSAGYGLQYGHEVRWS